MVDLPPDELKERMEAAYGRWLEYIDRYNAGHLEIAEITLGEGTAVMSEEQREGIEQLEQARDRARDEYFGWKEAFDTGAGNAGS